MTRKLTLLLVFLAASISAFADIGFCPPPGSPSACTTPTGADGRTIGIPRDVVDLEGISLVNFWLYGGGFLGGGGSMTSDPWYILLAVPNNVGGEPTLLGGSIYVMDFVTDAGTFLRTTTGSIYDSASGVTGISGGNGSMSADNMFGSDEATAFGSTPTSFQIFVYSVTPALADEGYFASVPRLVVGTFLAAIGCKQELSEDGVWRSTTRVFSTPFRTAGLVTSSVPEPSSLLLLATAAGIALCVRGRRTMRWPGSS